LSDRMRVRLVNCLIMLALHGLIYLLNSRYFDIGKPYYLYTVSWTSRRMLPLAGGISALAALLGKSHLSVLSFAGYVLGIILGELFGGFARDVPPQYTHYGWLIWGCTFLLSVGAGVVVERGIRKRLEA
jgi:hypothetical protein